jgi:hypothetical protein
MHSFKNNDPDLADETGSETALRLAAFVAFAGLCGLSVIALVAVIFQLFHH